MTFVYRVYAYSPTRLENDTPNIPTKPDAEFVFDKWVPAAPTVARYTVLVYAQTTGVFDEECRRDPDIIAYENITPERPAGLNAAYIGRTDDNKFDVYVTWRLYRQEELEYGHAVRDPDAWMEYAQGCGEATIVEVATGKVICYPTVTPRVGSTSGSGV